MRCIRPATLAVASVLSLATGCQHAAPRPLDWAAIQLDLGSRPLDVEPVRTYAEHLAQRTHGAPRAFDPGDGLGLHEAEAVALWYNADLRVARLYVDKAAGLQASSGRWADPSAGFETGQKTVESGGGSLLREAAQTSRSWIHLSSLSVTIPMSGRPRLERKLQHADLERSASRATEAEWRTLVELRNAWIRWSAATCRVAVLDTHRHLLESVCGTTQSLAQAGELPPSSARIFAIETMQSAAELDRARAEEQVARITVLHLMGLLPDAPVTLLPELAMDAPAPPDPARLLQHPSLLRVQAEYALAEAQLRLELRKQYPDLTLSPSYAHESDESTVAMGLGFPIPLWDANRRGIAEALATREIARAEVESTLQALQVESAQADAALRGIRIQRTRLNEEVAPAIDAQLDELRTLLALGELDIAILFEALSQLLDTKLALLQVAMEESLAATRLAASTGADVFYGLLSTENPR